MLRSPLLATALFVLQVGSAGASDFDIMIATWRGCEDACQGFQDYLTERGVKAEFILRDADQQEDTLPGFLAEARARKVDLILTWGTTVSRRFAGTLANLDDPSFNHDIPQVFTIVADPIGAGIVKSLEQTGRENVTGTYNRVPESVNVETIRSYLPEFRRLGMLYNANERNSVLKQEEVRDLATQMDFELMALELPLGHDGKPQTGDIAPAIAALKTADVDFLYLGSSSFLQDNRDAVTEAAVANGIPVLSPYEVLVRESKALISVAPRYYDVGRLAGEQAHKILVDGISPGDLPVLAMTRFAVVINLGVARELKLFPPLDLLRVAETVH